MTVGGVDIAVEKKNIKNLHLYVKAPRGDVALSAPLGMSDKAIEMFARLKIGWIRQQRAAMQTQRRQSRREYVSGESFFLWGREYRLRVEHITTGPNSLTVDGGWAILKTRKSSTPEQREKWVREWLRVRLKEAISRRLPVWERKTGLRCVAWQTKYMTTKWGSYSRKTGKIWFNLQLAKKEITGLDYVIVHELTHQKDPTHGPVFTGLMDKYMSNWRAERDRLNEQTLDYYED